MIRKIETEWTKRASKRTTWNRQQKESIHISTFIIYFRVFFFFFFFCFWLPLYGTRRWSKLHGWIVAKAIGNFILRRRKKNAQQTFFFSFIDRKKVSFFAPIRVHLCQFRVLSWHRICLVRKNLFFYFSAIASICVQYIRISIIILP